MLQIGFVENAFSEDLATESTLSRFHYYDVLVEGNVTYALTSTPIANAQVFTNPDGSKFPVQEIWLLKIDNSTRKITSAPKIGDYAASHGVLSISGDSIRAAFNYKARSGDYAMSGKFYSWSKTEFSSSTAQSLFENANCGWYPKFLTTGLTVEHFCYSGYYRVQGVTIIGQVQPAVMAQEYNDLLKSHSQGIVPKTTDAEVVQALLKSFPATECPKGFTQTELDKAVGDAKSAADTAGYNRGLAAAPKGITQAELEAAKSAAATAGYSRGYQAGLAAAPKGFTQTQLDAAKKSGYDEGYNKGVADTTVAKPPVNPTPVAPVITSVTPSSLKEGQAIMGDPTTWFSLAVRGSNFSNPAVFIPGVEQTLVSSTANEIVLQVKHVYPSSAEKQVPQGDRSVLVKNKDASGNAVNEATKSGILTVTDRPILPVTSPLTTLTKTFDFCAAATIDNKSVTHEGVDYRASLGNPVYSICGGTVKLNNTARNYGNLYDNYWNSFLIVEHSCDSTPTDAVYGYYGHLTSNLANGTTVKKGDVIGYIRESYGANDVRTPTNDHLHFGLNTRYLSDNWGYSAGNLSCDAIKTNGWLNPETYLAFQQSATPTTKNDPKLISPIDNTQNMSTNGVSLNWDLNNTASTVSDVKLTLREAASYNATGGNSVGTCNAKSIGKVTSYSSNSCGALKANQWYKWWVELNFNDGSKATGNGGYFMTATTTTPAPTLTALTSNCPTTTLNSGGNATCKAIATYSDSSTKDVTASTTWSSNNTAALTASQGNLVAGNVSQSTNVGITVRYSEKTTTKTSMLSVTVLKAVDTEKPKGSISPSIGTSYTQGDQISVRWSASDNMQLAKVSFNVTTGGNTAPILSLSTSVTSGWTDNGKTGSGVHYVDTSKLLGTYYYALWVKDATGNEQSYTGSFVVKEKPDTTKPTGQLTTSIKSSYVKGERVTVGWSASDDKQLAKVSFNVAAAGSNTPDSRVSMTPVTTGWKNNGTLGAGSYQMDTGLLTAGTYYYALWVKDAAGNEQSYNGSFTVTVPPPQVTGVSPLTVYKGKLATFTVTGSNLPDTLAFYLKDCPSPTLVGSRSATMQKFSCTPSYTTGVKDGKVNDKTNGSTLKPFNVTVK